MQTTKAISIALILAFIGVSISFGDYCQNVTPVSQELQEKAFLLAGEQAKYIMKKDYKAYKTYPYYDLNNNIVGYEVLFYFGDGDMPTDEELFENVKLISNPEMSEIEKLQIAETQNIYNSMVVSSVNSIYENAPVSGSGAGLPPYFMRFFDRKRVLENYLNIKIIDYDIYKCVHIYGDQPYAVFNIDGKDYYIPFFQDQDAVYTKEDLTDKLKDIHDVIPKEVIDENVRIWNNIDQAIKDFKNSNDIYNLLEDLQIEQVPFISYQ